MEKIKLYIQNLLKNVSQLKILDYTISFFKFAIKVLQTYESLDAAAQLVIKTKLYKKMFKKINSSASGKITLEEAKLYGKTIPDMLEELKTKQSSLKPQEIKQVSKELSIILFYLVVIIVAGQEQKSNIDEALMEKLIKSSFSMGKINPEQFIEELDKGIKLYNDEIKKYWDTFTGFDEKQFFNALEIIDMKAGKKCISVLFSIVKDWMAQ